MKARYAVIASVISALSAAALAHALATPGAAAQTAVSAAAAAPESRWAQFGRRHGRWGRGGHGRGHLCGPGRDQRIDEMIGLVEAFVGFTPEQAAAWKELAGEARAAGATIAKVCDDLEESEAKTAPARLAGLEAAVAAGLDVLRRVRPPFDKFYATLTGEQRKALDEAIAQGRRH